ncbi:AAA family ATPase [Streptomyces qinglanensis]|uniref:Pilus assembly protein CpaE n=1 Tax=Streptomyces qinglanensis TaxID=943816 RepID=A0A1H9UWU4_9ACTN|nr:AAA family ATPase [Streptomyces qinglanensis]SES14020.1 pilus assembly protein CpaE [Streptomyces qinglanensis]
MVIRIQPAVSDPDAARPLVTLLSQLPDAEPLPPAVDSGQLLDALAQQAAEAPAELPEVVLVHELIGPVAALELISQVALRFPAVAVVLATQDTSPALYAAAMDAGARGVAGLPLNYDELAARVGAAAAWATGVRRHLGGPEGRDAAPPGAAGPGGGTVVTVSGAKGGVGTTLTAVQLALAARAAGRSTVLADLDLQSGDVASFLDVRFRRSVADLAGIKDLTPRVLQDAVYPHETGLGLLLAPDEGERGEDVDERTARQLVAALRSHYETVVLDCGSQMHSGNAAAVEAADLALLLTTPDVLAVRGAKRMVRMWDRLRIRTAQETVVVVNRASRQAEIQPQLVARITGSPVARTTVPAHFKELQSALDAGRMQDLDPKGSVRQALWALAGELGLAAGPGGEPPRGPAARRRTRGSGQGGGGQGGGGRGGGEEAGHRPALAPQARQARQALPPGPASGTASPLGSDRGALGIPRRQVPPEGRTGAWGGDRGSLTVEFAGMAPVVLLTLVLLWQCVLIGYTFSLAGNSADEAARAATAAAAYGDPQSACEAAARAHLPAKWRSDAAVSCTRGGTVWKADVDLRTPLLFPGGAGLPFTVSGAAGAAEEG